MLEYHDNKLCIPVKDLIGEGIMTDSKYRYLLRHNKISSARQGKGLGNYALVVVNSLPDEYKDKITRKYPNGDRVLLLGWLKKNYTIDQNAMVYYMSPGQCGLKLPADKVNEYVNNASVLNTCIKLYNNAKAIQKTMGEKYDWEQMAQAIDGLRELYGHTLPTSVLRFRKKVAEYKRDGYASLISGKFGNQSARKVDYKTERLILSLAVQPNKPFNTSVHEMYISFVCGESEVYDLETGELLNPNDFADKTGEPKELSEATINNYLNAPKNRVLIEHRLQSWTTFMHEQAPHVHRHAPEFSLSKISFDDRDLPRKLQDSKARPKAYYAYDVASQCVVGYAYNRNKNVDLVVECFRSMFRLCERKGWGTPAQVEVENHLMSQWKDSFLKAGVLFPFVRFCAPQNSQEKYAEPMNGAKKRSIEHRNHQGIGRFYAKGRAYRTESKKISDETNDTYEDRDYYSWDDLIADDMRDVEEFNHALHPNQKKYPGMTRWDVLEAQINPTLQPLDKAVLARYIGDKVSTTIRRNSYCRVAYEDWWLSRPEALENLAPNNWNVDAYYLPDEDGNVTDVYIYQNDLLIDKLQRVGTFNRADCEQTEEDKKVYVAQQKKISSFRAYVESREIGQVGVIKPVKNFGVGNGQTEAEEAAPSAAVEAEEAVEIEVKARPEAEGYYSMENYSGHALDDL